MSAPLDSRQLRAFCALARSGSFTQAARELHITQSGVSHSIRALEEDLGCRLLDRLGKKALLTHAGEQLLSRANDILQRMSEVRESIGRLEQQGHGRLRVGAKTAACQMLVPAVLRDFKESFPQYAVTIEPGDTSSLAAAALAGRVDLALTLEPENEPQLEFTPVFTDELRFIVGPQHRVKFARAGRASRSDAGRQHFLYFTRKRSQTFRMIETILSRRKAYQLESVMGDGKRRSDQGHG